MQQCKKGTNYRKGNQELAKAHKMNLISDETTASANIAIALEARSSHLTTAMVRNAFKKITRFCGGMLFDVSVVETKKVDNYYWYHADTDPTPLQNIQVDQEVDYKSRLNLENVPIYKEWEQANPIFSGFLKALNFSSYRLIGSGYALLHEPQHDTYSRADSKAHAWAEPVFSLIELGNTPYFFKYKEESHLLMWV